MSKRSMKLNRQLQLQRLYDNLTDEEKQSYLDSYGPVILYKRAYDLCYRIKIILLITINKIFNKLSDSEQYIYKSRLDKLNMDSNASDMTQMIVKMNVTISRRPKDVKRDMLIKELMS